MFSLPKIFVVAILAFSAPAWAQTPVSLIVDDFENGVSNWTRTDKNRVGLSDIQGTAPGAFAASKNKALLSFKSAQASWASLSRPIDGPQWSKNGAQTLKFWINGSGEKQGVILQLRAKWNGQDLTFGLPRPIRLDIQRWRQVAIPLSDFKGPKGETLAPRAAGLYLLQFQQSGTWSSRFFSLDDISIEGNGKPLVAPTPTPAPPKPTPVPAIEVPGETKISVDFRKIVGTIRASGNVSIGAPFDARAAQPLEGNAEFRAALGVLKPKFARLDAGTLVDLTDSSLPAFSYARLLATARRAKSLGATILVSLPNAPQWGLDERGYAALCAGAAKALTSVNARYFELAAWSDDLSDATALGFYNAAYGALKAQNRRFVVGGFGARAGDVGAQNALLKGARGLDFLAVSVSGVAGASTTDAVALKNAREIPTLKTSAGLLDKSRFRRAALFVTQANFALSPAPGEGISDDARQVAPIAGAWWGQFYASGSRLADQIFHSDAVNAPGGLLDGAAKAYPAYYGTWLWNTFFPSGSARVAATSSGETIFTSAANTATAHNLLLVNTTNEEQTAQISIRGFPVLRQARLRIFDDPRSSVKFSDLPKSPFQTIKLAPYAVAVVQFLEPPK